MIAPGARRGAMDALVDPCAGVFPRAACTGVARGASSGGRDVGRVVGLRGVSVASAVWRGASLARPVFGTAMRWSPSGVAFWAYPRAWATAEVRVGAGVGESQV